MWYDFKYKHYLTKKSPHNQHTFMSNLHTSNGTYNSKRTTAHDKKLNCSISSYIHNNGIAIIKFVQL